MHGGKYGGIDIASLPDPIPEEVQTEFTTSGAEESFERSWGAGQFESCVFNPVVREGMAS